MTEIMGNLLCLDKGYNIYAMLHLYTECIGTQDGLETTCLVFSMTSTCTVKPLKSGQK